MERSRCVPGNLTVQAHAVRATYGSHVVFYATNAGCHHPWMVGWSTRQRAGALIGEYDEATARRCVAVLEAAGLRVTDRVSVRHVWQNFVYTAIRTPPSGCTWSDGLGMDWSTGRPGDDTGRPGDELMRQRGRAGEWAYYARLL